MIIKNKKATHVGVILSFVIFITFVIFIVVILKPTSNLKSNEESTVLALKKNIENFASDEITSFILSPSISASCYIFDETGFNLDSLNHSVKNENHQNLESYRDSNNLYIEQSNLDTIYNIDYSPKELNTEILSSPTGCESMQVNSIKKTNKIIEPKINELILKQENNYSGLKQDFNIPSDKDFGIKFIFENQTFIGKEIPDHKKPTYVKKFQIIYLDLNANEKIGNFIIYII